MHKRRLPTRRPRIAMHRPRARRRHQLHRHRRRLRPGRPVRARARQLVRRARRSATRSCSPPSSAFAWARARTAPAPRATASCAPSRTRCARLKTDRIDLYQIHMQDIDDARGGDAARARRSRARRQGALPRLLELRGLSADRQPVAVAQPSTSSASSRCRRSTAWSCATSSASTCRCAAVRARHPAVVAARGRLSDRASTSKDAAAAGGRAARQVEATGSRASTTPRNWRILDAVARGRGELRRDAGAVALAWLLAKPAVTSVIFGARTVEQLDDNLEGARARAVAPTRSKRLDEASALRARLSVRVHEAHPGALVGIADLDSRPAPITEP